MKTSNKADGIISTDLLTNEVICIHTDGSVDVVVSNDNDNDEVGNIEHGVEMTVQNDESPKVFSFEECKAAAEQCEDVGEFILKFTDEYDCAHQNDWLKDLFYNPAAPHGFWNDQTISYVARRCKTKKEFHDRYILAYDRARVLGMLDTFDWFIPGRGYYTKEMVFEISHKYTCIDDWMNNKEDSRFYRYAKDNGWLDEMTWVERTNALPNEWDDYEKCLAASKECKHKTEFQNKYSTAYRYSKVNGWLDDFFTPIEKKVERVYEIRAYEYELNGHKEVHIYHYFEGMDYRATLQFKNYRVANNLDIDLNSYKILATGLTRINKIKPFIDFMNLYEKDGWNIAIKPFYVQKEYKDKHWKFDKDEIIRKAKTCKTLLEFRTKYSYDYNRVDVKLLRLMCPWLYETISYSIDELKEIISNYDSRSDLKKNNSHIYNYLKNNNLLDELFPSKVKNEEYWIGRKDEIIELSKQFKSVKDFEKVYPSEYNASIRYGFYNELLILLSENKKPQGYWRDYNNIRNEALKYDLYRDFSRGCPEGCKYAKRMGWLEDFDWLKKRYIVDLNKHEHWVYAYIDEENKYVYIGLTRSKSRHKQHNTKKNDKGEYKSTAKRYFESVNKPLPQPIILKNGLNAEEAQYYEDYFVKKYESEGWNILNIGATGIGRGSLGGGFNKWNDENVTKVAKTCKTLKEFLRKYRGGLNYARKNCLVKTFDWLKQSFYRNWTEEQFVEYFNQFNNRRECFSDKTSKAMFNFAYHCFELKGVKWYHRRKSFNPNCIKKLKAYSRQLYWKRKAKDDKPKEDNNE